MKWNPFASVRYLFKQAALGGIQDALDELNNPDNQAALTFTVKPLAIGDAPPPVAAPEPIAPPVDEETPKPRRKAA